MKIISLSIVLGILCIASSVHAVATPPSQTVWVTPSDAKTGEEIMLNAFVYNDTSTEASVTVEFTQGSAEQVKGVATATITVPASTAKIATATWKMPDRSMTVTAEVTKASTKAKKDIPTLLGVVGTVTVGGTPVLAAPDLGGIKKWFGGLLTHIETYRLKQAEHYAVVLKKSKSVVNGDAPKDIVKLLLPDDPNTATPTTAGQTTGSVKEAESHTGDYANMVFATAAESFFAHKAFFYISIVIVALFVLRFIFGRFF